MPGPTHHALRVMLPLAVRLLPEETEEPVQDVVVDVEQQGGEEDRGCVELLGHIGLFDDRQIAVHEVLMRTRQGVEVERVLRSKCFC